MPPLLTRLVVVTTVFFAILAAFMLKVAGRIDWFEGWFFLGEFYLICMLLGLWLYGFDRKLLIERLQPVLQAEQENWDKILMAAGTVLTTAWITLMALDGGRWHLHSFPLWLEAIGALLLAACGAIVYLVFRENTFAAPIVRLQIERDHKVVSTGPYSLVRHPMYMGTMCFFVGVPLLLGSLYGLYFLPLLVTLLAVRIVLEERTLVSKLPGYEQYAQKVRFRLLPGIW